MTAAMLLAFAALAVTLLMLVSGRIPLEVVAFLVMGGLPLLGLVTPAQAIAGFSSPAVITLWAVFILSGALSRAGVGDLLGRQLLRVAGRQEVALIVMIMATAALLSAIMNNVAVAALMLPVVMDVSRHSAIPPSRLLMPLAYGALLGGLTTQIGTPPNILVSAAMAEQGLTSFRMFDFTPLGGAILLAGIAFMALLGRHLLPRRDPARSAAAQPSLRERYDLRERMFVMRIPAGSPLSSKTLAQCRLSQVLGLTVLEIIRDGRHLLAPGPGTVIFSDDRLLVQGRLERMEELRGWRELSLEQEGCGPDQLIGGDIQVARCVLRADSELLGQGIRESLFFRRYGVNVLAAFASPRGTPQTLEDYRFAEGDSLLVQGPDKALREMASLPGFADLQPLSRAELTAHTTLQHNLLTLRIGADSTLAGRSLHECNLGDAFGLRILAILRDGERLLLPAAEQQLQPGDRLATTGRASDLQVLQGLEGLELQRELGAEGEELETADVGLFEVVLSPHSRLAKKTLRELHFREKFGLSVIALWREGRAYRSGLRDLPLQFGDALLIYGPRGRFALLASDPDFLVLTREVQEPLRRHKLATALLVLLALLLSVIVGGVPIYIAAVLAAAGMILSGCLSMEEAYRSIEWRGVFLIAGLLPLGTALEQSGGAHLLAKHLVSATQAWGPHAVLAALVVFTALGTCLLPPAALVVLLMPIVFNTASHTGLSAEALAMGVAMASASLMSPFSHPANILVMGPGGYSFRDYLRVGAPLTLVVLATIMLLLPLMWPLQG